MSPSFGRALDPERFADLQRTQLARNPEHIRAEAELLVIKRDLHWNSPYSEISTIRNELQRCDLPLLSTPSIAPLPTQVLGKRADWSYLIFLDYSSGEHHSALVLGDVSRNCLGDGENVLVRVHSSSKLSDIFLGKNSDSAHRFEQAMAQIVQEGRGIILYLEQDGRGHGTIAQAEALKRRYYFDGSCIKERTDPATGSPISVERAFSQAGFEQDSRDYQAAGEILKALSVKSIRLSTHSPEKAIGIASCGIQVALEGTDLTFPAQKPKAANTEFMPHTLESPSTWNGDLNLDQVYDFPSSERQKERVKYRLEAHCRTLDAEVRIPWETVAKNRVTLELAEKPLVRRLCVAPAPTERGDWTMVSYGDYTTGEIHRALVFGDLENGSLGDGKDVMLRIHSSCKTNEIYHAINCECKAELEMAMVAIQKEGRGVLLYLDQEGRGTGIFGKTAQLRGMYRFESEHQITEVIDARTNEPVQTVAAYTKAGYPAEVRDFSVGIGILRDLKVESVRIMTNNPAKTAPLERAGIAATPISIIADIANAPSADTLRRELRDKATYLGHTITPDQLS